MTYLSSTKTLFCLLSKLKQYIRFKIKVCPCLVLKAGIPMNVWFARAVSFFNASLKTQRKVWLKLRSVPVLWFVQTESTCEKMFSTNQGQTFVILLPFIPLIFSSICHFLVLLYLKCIVQASRLSWLSIRIILLELDFQVLRLTRLINMQIRF